MPISSPNLNRLSPARRSVALVFAIAGLLMLTATVLAWWNPWRLTLLMPLSEPPGAIIGMVVAWALACVAAAVALIGQGRQATLGLLVIVVVVTGTCSGLSLWWLGNTFGPASRTTEVLDVSPDGQFEVVAFSYDAKLNTDRLQVVVRSREGLLSQEAPDPIAVCADELFGKEIGPESVHFTSNTTVAVPVRGANSEVVGFDPDSLVPARTVKMCG